MNKTIKLKQLVEVMPQSARLLLYEVNWNGDTDIIENTYVGDYDNYSTYMERHIKYIEIHGSIARIFI